MRPPRFAEPCIRAPHSGPRFGRPNRGHCLPRERASARARREPRRIDAQARPGATARRAAGGEKGVPNQRMYVPVDYLLAYLPTRTHARTHSRTRARARV